ncbi:MAG: hypothetical protein WCC10_17920 [Tumebacillaceae bacterium]
MSILILNRTKHITSPYKEWLADLNEDLLLLTSADVLEGYEGYEFIETFGNYRANGLVELRAMELYETHKYRTLIAVGEYDLWRAGRLRDTLGLPGQSAESALAFRDKPHMKDIVRAAGLDTPEYCRLHSSFDLIRFLDQHGYPVVIKPVDGAGSTMTTVLRSRQDLETVLQNGLQDNLEVETFVEGQMYHIDGLVLNGTLEFAWPSRYLNGCLAYQDGKALGSVLLDADNPLTQRLREHLGQLLAALPTPEITTIHAEVFHTPDDRLVLCEIASRTGGARVNTTIETAFGVPLTKSWVQAQCGLELDKSNWSTEQPNVMSGWLLVPPKQGTFLEAPKTLPFPWVAEYLTVKPGKQYGHAASSIDHVAAFVVTGATETEVEQRLQAALDWFEQEARWELTRDRLPSAEA